MQTLGFYFNLRFRRRSRGVGQPDNPCFICVCFVPLGAEFLHGLYMVNIHMKDGLYMACTWQFLLDSFKDGLYMARNSGILLLAPNMPLDL